MTKINLHDVVALTEDTKAQRFPYGEALLLPAGLVGTVVEKYNQGEAFEVEFAEKNGEAYALITIEAEKLFLLRFEPAELAFAS
ncbi:MAG: DUF4926 domain-containing protein [Phormidesmis sp.]